MARAWSALLFAAACGRVGFDRVPASDAAPADGEARDARSVDAQVSPPTFVQHSATTQGNTQTASAGFGAAVAANDLIVIALDYGSIGAPAATLTDVADTLGDHFTSVGPYDGVIDTNTGESLRLYISYGFATQAGQDEVTTTLSGSAGFAELRIHEYANVGPAPFDVSIGSAGTTAGSDAAASTITTADSNELIFAAVIDSTVESGTGYTGRGSDFQDVTEDRVAPTASTYPVLGSPNGAWVMAAAAFRGR